MKFEQIQPKLEETDRYQSEPVYVQVLHWIQLRFHECWIELELSIAYVEPPRFGTLYEAIRYQQWMRPTIPATYLATPTKKCRGGGEREEKGVKKKMGATKEKTEGSYVANPHKVQRLPEKNSSTMD
jgi:hypothetical protein